MVLISNRIVNFTANDHFDTFFKEALTSMCTQLTIIIVGRPEVNSSMLNYYYGNITNSLYAVPDYNCLQYLINCIPPCGMTGLHCREFPDNGCPTPTAPTTITTMQPPTTPEPFPSSWHIMYVFALSWNITEKEFEDIKSNVESPIDDYLKIDNLTVAFLFPHLFEAPWLTDAEHISSKLNSILYAHETLATIQLIRKTVSRRKCSTMRL
jgi:hypothetical protein